MAEKIIKTRVKLLYKTFEEWQNIKDTFVPYKGELCIVDIPASTGEVVNEPAVLFKVGDGENTYSKLPYVSAKAADVYGWAKKEYLDWDDLSDTFKEALTKYIGGKSTLYQIVKDETNEYVWQLQKSEDAGETWTEATGTIDVSALSKAVENTVASSVETETGTSAITNKENSAELTWTGVDGHTASVGVADATGTSDAYTYLQVKDSTTGEIIKLALTKDGAYYVKGDGTIAADNELVTKADIKDLESAMHFIGLTTVADGETVEQAIARILEEKSHTAVAGDVVILNTTDSSKEYIYDGTNWKEIGDESLYATKASLQAEVEAREAADEAIKESITNLATIATTGNVNDLVQTDGDVLIIDCN